MLDITMVYLKQTKYTKRILARIVIEAATPLAVGSGESDIKCDALVVTDANGLPYIPATSIAGVLRSMIESEINLTKDNESKNEGIHGIWNYETVNNIFGFQKGNKGHGSEIIFSEAKILNHTGTPVDGLNLEAIEKDPLLRNYQNLPIRQHVSISDKGVAKDGGKFDEQIVYKGTRFCFEIEMVCKKTDLNNTEVSSEKLFHSVLQRLYNREFRIGSGTRSGFGSIKIVDEIKILSLDLEKEEDLNIYLEKSSSLDTDFWNNDNLKFTPLDSTVVSNSKDEFIEYSLTLKPESFFLFASGFGDDDVDITPVMAKAVEWEDQSGRSEGLLDNLILIPATSVKGVLSHRVAFHWNRMNGVFSDYLKAEEIEKQVGQNNPAVRILFGSAGQEEEDCQRGNVLFSDKIKQMPYKKKILNHVSIDRFTGGGVGGALFSEKVVYVGNFPFEIKFLVDKQGVKEACKKQFKSSDTDYYDRVLQVLKEAVKDFCDGSIQLGGGVNRGHGVFKGSFKEYGNE